MKVLNLYAGIGGNRKLWEGCDVVAIEHNPEIARAYQQNFPEDLVIIADAHDFLHSWFNEFDFIWSSPPCQTHSRMVKATRHDSVCKYPDMRLYQEIILLQEHFKGKWVVENVNPYYEPLIHPTQRIDRHLFWGNFRIGKCEYEKMPNLINQTTVAGADKMKQWLGLDYKGYIYTEGNHHPTQVLRNCVHPKIGEYIFNCAKEIYIKSDTTQADMFR